VSSRRRLVAAVSGMAAVTVASRLSGYLRDKAVATLIGAGTVSDAFVTGFRIPNMFRAFLAEGALHAAFIPTLASLRAGGDEARPRLFVRHMTAALLVALPVVVLVGIVVAPALVHLLAPAFAANPEKFALTVRLTRLMFPYLAFISLAALAQGVLNASHRFLLAAATPIALNLCIVLGTVAAVWIFGGRGEWLAIGVLAGGLAQFLMQWPACGRAGLPLCPQAGFHRSAEVRRVLALMAPGVPALGIYQVTLLLSTRFAASVGEGAVTCMYNASRLNELVYGVVIVQLTTAVLPMLAEERAVDEQKARDTLAFALRLLSVVALPAAAFAAVAAVPVTGALFGGGRYSEAAVATTAVALSVYALGLPFLGLTKLLASASYAWQDTRSPVIAAASSLVAFLALGVLWTERFGVAGVAGATSLAQGVNAAVLLWLNGRAGRLPRALPVLAPVVRHVVAAVALGGTAWVLGRWLHAPLVTGVRSLVALAATATAAIAVYVAVLVALRAPEWRELRQLVSRRLAR